MFATFVISVAIVLGVSFVCSLTEAVLLSINVNALANPKSKAGSDVAAAWRRMKSNIGRPIAAILILNTVANTGGATVAGAEFTALYGSQYLWIFSICMTVSILFGTEILPKTIGVAYNRVLAPFLTLPLEYATKFLSPFIWLTEFVTKRFASDETSQISSSDIITMASMARSGKAIGLEQENIIVNAIRLSHSPVRTAMIPRNNIKYIIEGLTLEENEKRLGILKHTRYPLCSSDSIDTVSGTVNHKKFAMASSEKSSDYELVKRDAAFVSEDVSLLDALRTMSKGRLHMLFVKDKYDRISGLLTLEDITDELVSIELPD